MKSIGKSKLLLLQITFYFAINSSASLCVTLYSIMCDKFDQFFLWGEFN